MLNIDESDEALTKIFQSQGLESSPVNFKAFREMILLTPSMESYISGVVVTPETARLTLSNGARVP
jgi:fructose-bisphosphate aldolase class 1